MAENNQQDRLKEIVESIERGIQELFESEKYRQYLKTMSRFHRYSVNNTMLIFMQKPDATLVAGFNKWRDQFKRHVNRGERGIRILAPTPYTIRKEQEKLDPKTKLPMRGPDGEVLKEEVEIKIPRYRPVSVFDVSQTDGEPLPSIVSDLTGNVQRYAMFMEALQKSSPVPITIEPLMDGSDGYFSSSEQKIVLNEGMSEVQTVSAAIHEIAHARLHDEGIPKWEDDRNYDEIEIFGQPALFSNGRLTDVPEGLFRYDLRGSDYDPGEPICVERNVMVNHAASIITAKPIELPEDGRIFLTEDNGINFVGGEMTIREFFREHRKDRGTQEVEAESVSYTVCQYYGIETADNSFGYIAGWSKDKTLPELRASLETISKTSSRLIEDIDKHFAEIVKQRQAEVQAQDAPFLNMPENGYAIYQLRPGNELRNLRFEPYQRVLDAGYTIDRANYELVYTGKLAETQDTYDHLNRLFFRFNHHKPNDFRGHSLSVSDIVAIKQNGAISCHYVDRWDFKELPDFLTKENPLKTAEMSVEDDYGMIDGIINNGKSAAEKEKERPSVLAQLKANPPCQLRKDKPKTRRKEMER